MDTPRLRFARLSDLPELLALEAQFPGDRLSARAFRHHLRSPRASLRIATLRGRTVGCALIVTRADSPLARLYSLVVERAVRGTGLGARLLADAERQARARGCHGLRLEVRHDNAAALALYGSAGYRLFARIDGYYEDGAAACRLEKRW